MTDGTAVLETPPPSDAGATSDAERKKAPGDPCAAHQAACLSDEEELACENGRLVRASCRGPKGCRVSEGKLSCDISRNRPGDRCSRDYEGHAQCADDGRAKVTCRSGSYVLSPCLGPDGCAQQGDTFADRASCQDFAFRVRSVSGKVSIEVSLDPKGGIKSVTPSRTQLPAQMVKCLVDIVGTLHFPARGPRDPEKIAFPLTFAPQPPR